MAVHPELAYSPLDELFLDPANPRLGRRNTTERNSQAKVLELMGTWALDELAVSFLENGFWPQEALVAHREELYGHDVLVVLEGNRRLAALKLLKSAIDGKPASQGWRVIAESEPAPVGLFDSIPYVLVDDRSDVVTYLGFRHVTGIKEWSPAEKAEYIGQLVDDRGMSYQEVARRIGSKADTVRRNHIAYRILRQIDNIADIEIAHVEARFSVMFLSLREADIAAFLGIDTKADPDKVREPVPADHLHDLKDYALWLFGTSTRDPLFSDSRHISSFARILGSKAAVEYLRSKDNPEFFVAMRRAGVAELDLMEHLIAATDEVEQVLSQAHLFTKSDGVRAAVERFARGAFELTDRFFPDIEQRIRGEIGTRSGHN